MLYIHSQNFIREFFKLFSIDFSLDSSEVLSSFFLLPFDRLINFERCFYFFSSKISDFIIKFIDPNSTFCSILSIY